MDSIAQVGSPAPEFALTDLEGKRHSTRDWLGSLVVLNFWSADCDHSTRADAVISELRQAWGDEVAVWCILSNENEADEIVRRVAKDNKVERILRDRDHNVADTYGAVTTPHVFVIDSDGILRYAGGLDDVSLRQRTPTRNYLKEAVEAILGGQSPEPAVTEPFGCAIVRAAV